MSDTNAELIQFDEVPIGRKVWIEYRHGHILECTPTKRQGAQLFYTREPLGNLELSVKKYYQIRFWNREPTQLERMMTPWPTN